MPDTTTVVSQMLYGVRLIFGERFLSGSIGRMMPLMARNLASVTISSFFMRCASSVKVCFSSVSNSTTTTTITENHRGCVMTTGARQ